MHKFMLLDLLRTQKSMVKWISIYEEWCKVEKKIWSRVALNLKTWTHNISSCWISNPKKSVYRAFLFCSVTAEKWVPIMEVPVNSLKLFLEKKKREGFSILGLEQTANSVSLDKYQFPKKTVSSRVKARTKVFLCSHLWLSPSELNWSGWSNVVSVFKVLVLGREKEGIPVDIIHVLDACVEIPQLGVVRSLNVHVSGAIALWEYTRQQRIQ